ncbi:SDR family NAD(P)-dependent oxidoreductase [Actinomadura bangladeshensis]|uniref:SDR family oxidoreductase n=1 Tax=Actinomadura bangladeshensis TaxID=453573 RepID=A0A6L9QRR3_9ACTN|nr:SDR family oxidoreductase [Actinomadura bangladeshensis]NEA25484.1 SDR family oxidoreductase [Actinomadura bangladeshensis]NEA28199.1 SDR family oxidoreductase [Actinomadura bangladeshensis]
MKTALITGGSRGLGRALAGELAADGWNLVIDGRDPDTLSAAASETGARRIAGDVTDPAHRAELVRAVSGGLDLLVNNASTLGPTPMPRLDSLAPADLAAVLATNVLAPLALIQAVLPSLRERRGAILNITSDAAVENYETWGGYGTSKAALEQLSNVLAAEEPDVAVWWADPGEMNTAMLRAAGEDADAAPPPSEAAAALRRLVETRPASGRHRVSDLVDAP